MEEPFDLFQLDLSPEPEDDPYYNYTSNEFGWTSKLENSHYSQIQEKLDKVKLARDNKQSTAELQQEINRLRKGWSRVGPILRAESEKLLRLPREIRDQIYAELYTERAPLDVTEDRLGSSTKQKLYPLPEALGRLVFDSFGERYIDRPLYLNAAVVHPDIAAEAAEFFYNKNAFDFDDYFPRRFSGFLATDHYESGVLPRDVISSLHLRACLIGDNHCELQDGGVDYLKPMFSIPQLRKVHLTLEFGYYFLKDIRRMPALDFHFLAEDVKKLTMAGVDVQVTLEHCRINPHWYNAYLNDLDNNDEEWDMPHEFPWKDISHWFSEPSEEDREVAERRGGVHIRDGKLVWGDTSKEYKGTRNQEIEQQYRVWLAQPPPILNKGTKPAEISSVYYSD